MGYVTCGFMDKDKILRIINGYMYVYDKTISRDKHNGWRILDPFKTDSILDKKIYDKNSKTGCYVLVMNHDHVITPRMFGAKGNGVSDDTNALLKAIDTALKNGYILDGENKVYKITKTINLGNYAFTKEKILDVLDMDLMLNDEEYSKLFNQDVIKQNSSLGNSIIKNINLISDKLDIALIVNKGMENIILENITSKSAGIVITDSVNSVKNIKIISSVYGINFIGMNKAKIENIETKDTLTGVAVYRNNKTKLDNIRVNNSVNGIEIIKCENTYIKADVEDSQNGYVIDSCSGLHLDTSSVEQSDETMKDGYNVTIKNSNYITFTAFTNTDESKRKRWFVRNSKELLMISSRCKFENDECADYIDTDDDKAFLPIGCDYIKDENQ